MRPLAEGWHWNGTGFEFREKWREEDLLSGLIDQQHITEQLVKAMSSIVEFNELEGDESSMFADDCLPTWTQPYG